MFWEPKMQVYALEECLFGNRYLENDLKEKCATDTKTKSAEGYPVYTVNPGVSIRAYKRTSADGQRVCTTLLLPENTQVVVNKDIIRSNQVLVEKHCLCGSCWWNFNQPTTTSSWYQQVYPLTYTKGQLVQDENFNVLDAGIYSSTKYSIYTYDCC